MKAWDRVENKLMTPRSAVSLTTDCAMGPDVKINGIEIMSVLIVMNLLINSM